ncbi:MAG: sulfatase-like hydrolase/transferase [Verrucomicrobiae bacterium]|nr:sulfatase-like hydrolase/transferase [Verrucomicrobiae bacterium]
MLDRFHPHIVTKLLSVGVFVSLLGQATTVAEAAEKPNLLFLFADDFAFDCVHQSGNHDVKTPNIDRLYQRGTVFDHAYNMGAWGGAVCVASRTMLVTGKFVWNAHKDYDATEAIYGEKAMLWPQLMKKVGYDTYFTGKWHIKADASKAFEVARHIRPGMPNQTPAGYDRPKDGEQDVWSPYDPKFEGFWKGGKHWSEVTADDAIEYIGMAKQKTDPFFMYVAFNAPHDPRQSPKEFVEKYPPGKVSLPENFLPEYPYEICGNRTLRDERLAPFPRTETSVKVNRGEYYAIITHLDVQIGRVLDALEQSGKAENTVIVFTADHGLAVGHHGLMGKQNMFDHSVRVPYVIAGPGIQAGRTIDAPIYLQDTMATALELAGAEKPDYIQFNSLLPMVRGNATAHTYDAIYGAYTEQQRMVTMDQKKLILYPKIGKALLFDLATDPLEMVDLAGRTDAVATMRRLFARFFELQKETGDSLDVAAAFPEFAL